MNNVLIIEDDKEICVMIKDHLEKYNYQVFFTLTGANAIERIRKHFYFFMCRYSKYRDCNRDLLLICIQWSVCLLNAME